MKKTSFILFAGIALVGTLLFAAPHMAQAAPVIDPCANSLNKDSPLCNNSQTPESVVETVVDTLLWIVGGLCVIMIIVSGLRYVLSNGNQQQVASAKNTLVYSVVGLLVAMFAYAIVKWAMEIAQKP